VAAEHSPLAQFEIQRYIPLNLGGYDISFTNSSAFMVIAVLLTTALLLAASSGARLVPTRIQSVAEVFYEFIAGMVRDNVGTAGLRYFPFVFTLFMFVLFGNLLGMIPLMEYGFTYTSHIVVTFALAIVIFIGVTVIGILRHGFHFFSLFVPQGVPKVMLLLLVPIELISYMIRPITLSVRLFANMMAGHTMLVIFSGFIVSLGSFYLIPGVIPLAATTAFMFLELLVAVLQAYVFTILTCIYLHDAIHLH
jgi:F-type H+-transporting ATPase subunit a